MGPCLRCWNAIEWQGEQECEHKLVCEYESLSHHPSEHGFSIASVGVRVLSANITIVSWWKNLGAISYLFCLSVRATHIIATAFTCP